MGAAALDITRPRIRPIIAQRQKPRVDKRFQYPLAGSVINSTQALNLLRLERQTRHFEVLGSHAVENSRIGTWIHNTPAG